MWPTSSAVLSMQQQDEKQSIRAGITVSLSAPILFSLGAVLLQCYSSSAQGWGHQKVLVPHTHKIDKNVEAPQAV